MGIFQDADPPWTWVILHHHFWGQYDHNGRECTLTGLFRYLGSLGDTTFRWKQSCLASTPRSQVLTMFIYSVNFIHPGPLRTQLIDIAHEDNITNGSLASEAWMAWLGNGQRNLINKSDNGWLRNKLSFRPRKLNARSQNHMTVVRSKSA